LIFNVNITLDKCRKTWHHKEELVKIPFQAQVLGL